VDSFVIDVDDHLITWLHPVMTYRLLVIRSASSPIRAKSIILPFDRRPIPRFRCSSLKLLDATVQFQSTRGRAKQRRSVGDLIQRGVSAETKSDIYWLFIKSVRRASSMPTSGCCCCCCYCSCSPLAAMAVSWAVSPVATEGTWHLFIYIYIYIYIYGHKL